MEIWQGFSWSVVVASLLVAVAWVTRTWWIAWIGERVRGDIEAELESLRSDLRTREGEIDALRETGLANVRASQAALTQRRLQAVDDLWAAVEDWGKLAGTLMVMSIIKFENVRDEIESNPRSKAAMQQMLKGAEVDFSGFGARAHSARPYVSDLAWALWGAYQTMYGLAAFQAKVVRTGIDARPFLKDDAVSDMLIKAMPDMTDYIKKSGSAAHFHLPEVLRQRILVELRATLDGKRQDAESVTRAAEIQKAVGETQAALAKQQKDAESNAGGVTS